MGVYVFAIVIVVFFVSIVLKNLNKPKVGDLFVCAGCGGSFKHTNRTVSAWSNRITRFYCGKCHKNWRDEQNVIAAQVDQGGDFPGSSDVGEGGGRLAPAGGGRGCMVFLVICSAVPVAVVSIIIMYA